MRLRVVAALLALFAFAPAVAGAKTVIKTVPGEVVYLNGQNPADPGNCSAVAFVQWKHVDGATAATAKYKRTTRSVTSDATERRPAPFDNTYKLVLEYSAPAGYDWIAISRGWSDGPNANDCSGTREKLKTIVAGPATVDLSIEIDPALCMAARATATKWQSAVKKLQTRVNRARGKEKARLKRALKRAKVSLAKANAKVSELC